MQIDTVGTYTLKYTAEDACGNVTEVTREVEAVVITYRTVLFTDGTFIINEKSTNRDANIALHGAVTNEYAPLGTDYGDHTYVFRNSLERLWHNQRTSVKAVEIGSPIKPADMKYWFLGFTNCTSFNFTNIDTSTTVSMSQTFSQCSSVANLDLSVFDTSAVTDMSAMFYGCTQLRTIDVSSFDTSNVTTMYQMFQDCSYLRPLDISNFNTSNVTTMEQMFYNCRYLQTLDLSNFNTSNVTNMHRMFYNCRLTSLNVSNFDTSNVTTMEGMFLQNYSLPTLDLSSFDTSNVTNMHGMFSNCTALTTIYVSSNFVVGQVTDSGAMFASATRLVGGAGTTYSSSYVDKTRAKIDGGTADPGYFTAKA